MWGGAHSAGGGFHWCTCVAIVESSVSLPPNSLTSSTWQSKFTSSKLAKVLPLLEKLNTNCQQFGVFHKNLSIDESVVPYRGLHSAKQFLKGKPVQFWYKMWMLCSVHGFMHNLDIYAHCGKDSHRTIPLGPHVVSTMLSPVSGGKQHLVSFDNFFCKPPVVVWPGC